ncbi:MAG: zinc ribbon domain-containing protein [Planctomycetota bacterium]|jgi:hypothetical protein
MEAGLTNGHERTQMQCPKCGTENSDDARACESCSFALTTPHIQQSKTKARTSKTVFCAVLLAGLSVILAIFVKPTLAFLAAVFGFLALITSIIQTIRGKKKLSVKHIAVGLFILVEITLLTYWRIDAAPIPNDYTINDIRSAPPEYNQTYTLLKSLADENEDAIDAPAIGLSSGDLKNLKEIRNIFKEDDLHIIAQQLQANEDKILSLWQNAKKGRDVLAKLDKFPEIADLTEPNWESEFSWLKNLKPLVYLHRAYICLQSCKGNHETAISELIRFDSIFRKMSLNARLLVTRLVCIACFYVDIETANFIINNPQTPRETVLFLKQRIVPFSDKYISLRNSIIFEYLMFKNELKKMTKEPRFRYSYFPPLKSNSTFRLYNNFCDKWISITENRTQIEELRVWPVLYPNLQVHMYPPSKLPWYYKTYNPVGSFFVYLMTPNMERIIEIRTKLQVHSDLLQIVLDKRLGRDVSLKARAYSDEYIVDVENEKIFSPGPDGEVDTKDDIKLLINPDVLGWQN